MADKTAKILETERLYARQFTGDDAPDLMPILGDPAVMGYTFSKPFTIEGLKSLLTNQIPTSYKVKGWGRYAVVKKDDDALIGYAGFSVQKLDNEEEKIDLGYGFAKKYWKLGYATEIARALVCYAQNTVKIPALIAVIHPENAASINVVQKAGFKFFKESRYHTNPVNVYEIDLKKSE